MQAQFGRRVLRQVPGGVDREVALPARRVRDPPELSVGVVRERGPLAEGGLHRCQPALVEAQRPRILRHRHQLHQPAPCVVVQFVVVRQPLDPAVARPLQRVAHAAGAVVEPGGRIPAGVAEYRPRTLEHLGRRAVHFPDFRREVAVDPVAEGRRLGRERVIRDARHGLKRSALRRPDRQHQVAVARVHPGRPDRAVPPQLRGDRFQQARAGIDRRRLGPHQPLVLPAQAVDALVQHPAVRPDLDLRGRHLLLPAIAAVAGARLVVASGLFVHRRLGAVVGKLFAAERVLALERDLHRVEDRTGRTADARPADPRTGTRSRRAGTAGAGRRGTRRTPAGGRGP